MAGIQPQLAPKVGITDLTLRDGHQSLFATRMKTSDMLPIVAAMDDIGYFAAEVWGGATFDACLRFLQRGSVGAAARRSRRVPRRPSSRCCCAARTSLGYKNYADDVVDRILSRSVGNGIDIIRIFDALNDMRNIEKAIEACQRDGGHAQGTHLATPSARSTPSTLCPDGQDSSWRWASDSICIKDMAGILCPVKAYELVARLKAEVGLPVELHSHYTCGVGSMTYLKAIEAGGDIVDSVLVHGHGHLPAADETMVATLSEMPCATAWI